MERTRELFKIAQFNQDREQMAKELSTLTEQNAKLREALGYWLSLRTTKINGVTILSPNNKEERKAMEAAQSLLEQK